MSYQSNSYQQPNPYQAAHNWEGQKSFVATWLLSWFLGGLGIDRFYLGKFGTGILKLITLGGFGIWALIDIILILAGAMRDKAGYNLAGYEKNKKTAWIVSLVMFLIGLGIGVSTGPDYMEQMLYI
ncbi:TM2 domain-containing protein [Glutamicibacter sp.]|uniref:TM2 domain-containing protein n=1 Tax=Glutamicibacter sp. TaxID=1931995 RepID=UPI0028BDE536|nr:TM2 domain-containing protein [Glutamicibacter sp.]